MAGWLIRGDNQQTDGVSNCAMSDVIKTSVSERIMTITLNRPQALNAISGELASTLIETIRSANTDSAVAGLVLTGAGEKSFCAGVDLIEARAMTAERIESWFGGVCEIYRTILMTDKPFIAALNGVAAGGGFQMALVSDLRVGHAGTKMGQPEINAGIPSVMGSYWMSLHVGWSMNQELSFTGRLMPAEECQRLGLLNRLVVAGELLATAQGLARDLAAKPHNAFLRTKQRFREIALRGFDEAFRTGVLGQQATYTAGEPQAVIDAFLAERAARK
jgi:enoyl-CoA hydratase/carnithine racemase